MNPQISLTDFMFVVNPGSDLILKLKKSLNEIKIKMKL